MIKPETHVSNIENKGKNKYTSKYQKVRFSLKPFSNNAITTVNYRHCHKLPDPDNKFLMPF